jgi:PPOX class probable F420-dependent enzyme
MTPEEERYLLSKARGFMATVNDDGTPTLVPVCFAYAGGVLYMGVDAKPKSEHLARIRNIRKRRRVAFIVDTYSKDWRRLSYLLVHGRAGLVSGGRERRRAAELLVKRYPQYRWLGKGMKQIVKITVERTKYWQFREPRRR